MGDEYEVGVVMYAVNRDGEWENLGFVDEDGISFATDDEPDEPYFPLNAADTFVGSLEIKLDDKGYRFWEWIFGIKPKPNPRKYFIWANRLWRKGHPKCRR